MLLIIKRGGVIFLTLILLLSFLLFSVRSRHVPVSATEDAIIIDAGHGEPDGGAVGESGVLEKDLNLSIAKLLEEKLKAIGEQVVMTRSENKGLYTEKSDSLREKKREDMKARVSIANSIGSSCLVSIHMNHFTDAKYSGPQVFYAAAVEGSRALAESIRLAFLNEIGPHCTREIKPVSKDLYLLREAKIPAVIVECGFLSNPTEEQLLLTPDYQDSIAAAICTGIQNFRNSV